MNDKLLIHIPHSKLKFSKIFLDKITIDIDKIESENIFMSDYLVDKCLSKEKTNVILFNYSRLFCDVERFKNDADEPLSKYGMALFII